MNFIIQALIYAVLMVASTVLQSMAARDQRQPTTRAAAGLRSTLAYGGDLAPEFAVGWTSSMGQLRYAGTWGADGETPNAHFSRTVEVSCLPIRGFTGWFVNGERVTLDATKTGDLGYAVLEYRVGGKDHLWINPYIGDQDAEDPLMVAKFGTDPDRPYADMIGEGCAYFVATALINRELFTALPEVRAEMDGIELDDPEEEDRHDNPIIAAYTLLKGLSYGSEWVYGPQTITDLNFRLDNIAAEAAKCELDLDGRKQFRCGLMVRLDDEPHAVVGKLLSACAGRWADLGGVYRFLVGAPGDPVVSITDEDLLTTEPQTLEPFPGLESRYNGMDATYPEPDEAWEMKPAPSRYVEAYEAVDDGRRRPFSTVYEAVPDAVQVQHLMRLAVEESRRFRRHTQTMPPEFWEYEPLDVLAWTSARNGYVAKSFLITLQEDLPTANQFMGLQEIDPADYPWSGDYELPFTTAPLVIQRPPAQPMTGWTAAPAYMEDPDGNGWLPSIEVSWAAGLVDVRAVQVQVREAWSERVIFDSDAFAYDASDLAPSAIINAAFLRKRPYQARGIYLPFSGRATEWSGWIDVTTPDVAPLPPGSVDPATLAAEIRNRVEGTIDQVMSRLSEFETQLGDLAQVVSEHETEQLQTITGLALRSEAASASVLRLEEVVLGPDGALAQLTESVSVIISNVLAAGYLRFTAEANEETGTVLISIGVKATNGEWTAIASQEWGAQVTEDGAESFVRVMADRMDFISTGGAYVATPFAIATINGEAAAKVTTLYFDNLFSTAEAAPGVPIIVKIGETGFESITVPE
jgi:hypothetical protein